MSEGSEIRVSDYAAWNGCQLFSACLSYRWRGINILNNGIIKTALGTTISDAQYAIRFSASNSGQGGHHLTNTILSNNLIGIFSDPTTNHIAAWTGIEGLIIDGMVNNPLVPYFNMPATATLAVDLNFMNEFPMVGNLNNPNQILNYPANAFNASFSNVRLDYVQFSNIQRIAFNGIGQSGFVPTIGTYTYQIENCTFFDISSGINIQNAIGTTAAPVLINKNTFYRNSTGLFFNQAIRYAPNVNTNSNFSIIYNSIKNAMWGIQVSMATSNGTGEVSVNDIELDRTVATGIFVTGCTGTNVISNEIYRGAPITTGPLNNVGIDVNTGGTIFVHRNRLRNLGTGVRYTGGCLGTQNRCNTLISLQRGFQMNNAFMSTQGTQNRPQNNAFSGFNTNPKITGVAILPIPFWFYKNSGSNIITPVIAAAAIPVIATSTWNCPVVSPQRSLNYLDSIEIPSDSTIEELISGTYEDAQEVSIEQSLGQLYELLQNNQTALTDSTYLAFYTNYGNTNSGTLYAIDKLIGAGDYTGAQNLIDSFIPARDDEYDMTTILGYLIRISSDSLYFLTSQDSSILLAIANKSVFVSGRAVLYARSILGLYLHDVIHETFRIGNSALIQNNGPFTYTKDNRIYNFYLEGNPVMLEIEVYNLSGQLVKETSGSILDLQGEPSNLIIKVTNGQSQQVYRNL
jgi:hypothetical protein